MTPLNLHYPIDWSATKKTKGTEKAKEECAIGQCRILLSSDWYKKSFDFDARERDESLIKNITSNLKEELGVGDDPSNYPVELDLSERVTDLFHTTHSIMRPIIEVSSGPGKLKECKEGGVGFVEGHELTEASQATLKLEERPHRWRGPQTAFAQTMDVFSQVANALQDGMALSELFDDHQGAASFDDWIRFVTNMERCIARASESGRKHMPGTSGNSLPQTLKAKLLHGQHQEQFASPQLSAQMSIAQKLFESRYGYVDLPFELFNQRIPYQSVQSEGDLRAFPVPIFEHASPVDRIVMRPGREITQSLLKQAVWPTFTYLANADFTVHPLCAFTTASQRENLIENIKGLAHACRTLMGSDTISLTQIKALEESIDNRLEGWKMANTSSSEAMSSALSGWLNRYFEELEEMPDGIQAEREELADEETNLQHEEMELGKIRVVLSNLERLRNSNISENNLREVVTSFRDAVLSLNTKESSEQMQSTLRYGLAFLNFVLDSNNPEELRKNLFDGIIQIKESLMLKSREVRLSYEEVEARLRNLTNRKSALSNTLSSIRDPSLQPKVWEITTKLATGQPLNMQDGAALRTMVERGILDPPPDIKEAIYHKDTFQTNLRRDQAEQPLTKSYYQLLQGLQAARTHNSDSLQRALRHAGIEEVRVLPAGSEPNESSLSIEDASRVLMAHLLTAFLEQVSQRGSEEVNSWASEALNFLAESPALPEGSDLLLKSYAALLVE